jgi:regulator of replication initiation timing
VIARSQKQAEELKALARDRKELDALRRHLDNEETENAHLTKVNAELQQQLKAQKKELEAHREQLKEQKKAHQGKPLLPSGILLCMTHPGF